MKIKLESRNNELIIKIPKTIADLYKLKEGMLFQIKTSEIHGELLLSLATTLEE